MKEKYLQYRKVLKRLLKAILPDREPSLFSLLKKEKKLTKIHAELINSKLTLLWLSRWDITLVILALATSFALSHPDTFLWVLHLFNDTCSKSILYFLEHTYSNLPRLSFQNSDHFQNLISIHAGIGAVLIGLAFFIAQEMANGSPHRGRILLKRSKFFPLLLAEVFFFFHFLWWDMNILVIVPIILIGLGTLYSLFETLNLFSNNFTFRKEEEKEFLSALKIRFLKLLDHEVSQLIGESILRKKLKKYSNLIEVSPFSPTDRKKFSQIKTLKGGYFYDFKLNKLNSFLLKFQKGFPEEYRDFLKNSEETANTDAEYAQKDPMFWISLRYNSSVEKDSDTLMWIQQDLIAPKTRERITTAVNDLFVIRPEDTNYEEIQEEISQIKTRCSELIEEQKAEELGKMIGFYVELVKEFYTHLEQYGGGFTTKQASDMRFEMAFGGFKTISWLSKDIGQVVEMGLKSENKTIIAEVMYLPVRLLQYAVEYKDHLIFQEFAYYPTRLYRLALETRKANDEGKSSFIFDRVWRHLNDLSRFYLEGKIEDQDYPKEEAKTFAVEVLRVFQSLLKVSFDNRDLIGFQKFLSVSSKLFKGILNSRSSVLSEDEALFDYLDGQRKEMFFGMAAWILFKLEQDKPNAKLIEFYNEIKTRLPGDIESFTKLFAIVHDFEREGFWGWDNWEMEENGEDDEMHSIDILSKLEKLYVVHSLTLLKDKSKEELAAVELPTSRDLAYLAEGSRSLMGTLENIEKNSGNWSFALDETSSSKTTDLKELLLKAKEKQEASETETKRKLKISNQKVDMFKKSVVKDFYENDSFRGILNYYNLINDETGTEYSGKIKNLGVNTLFDKAAFFDDTASWHVHILGMEEGFEFGRAMATGENTDLLQKLKAKSEIIQSTDFEARLKILADPIILAINNASWRFFEESEFSKNFQPKWSLKDERDSFPKELSGLYRMDNKNVPVFELYDDKNTSFILILDSRNLGALTQYSPLDKTDDISLKEDIFKMNVQEFLEDSVLMESFLNKPPEWLAKLGTRMDQENYLKERVLIHIFERFEFTVSPDFKGCLIEVNKQ